MSTRAGSAQRRRVARIAYPLVVTNILLAWAEPVFDLDPNAWSWLTVRSIVFLPMVVLGLLWLGLVLRDTSRRGRDSS